VNKREKKEKIWRCGRLLKYIVNSSLEGQGTLKPKTTEGFFVEVTVQKTFEKIN